MKEKNMRNKERDDKKIKKYVLDELWPKSKKKTGDRYRSLSIQVDTMLKHIYDEDSLFNWMELEKLPEREIADFIITFISRKSVNRLLYTNLEYKMLRYDYCDLIVEDVFTQNEKKWFAEGWFGDQEDEEDVMKYKFDFDNKYNYLKIKETIPLVWEAVWEAKPGEYNQMLRRLCDHIRFVIEEIKYEQNLFLQMGIDFYVYFYLDELNEVLETIARTTLLKFVILNNNITDKSDVLIKLKKNIDCLENDINKAIKKNEYEQRQVFEVLKYEKKLSISSISASFSQFLFRRALYGEQEWIFQILKKEIEDAEYSIPKNEYYTEPDSEDEEKVQAYITEGQRVPDFKEKLNTARQLIEMAKETQKKHFFIKQFEFHQVLLLKIVFRELFMKSKAYRDKGAYTIVKDLLFFGYKSDKNFEENNVAEYLVKELLSKEPLPRVYLMYLDARLERGFFRELGMLNEYQLFNEILIRYRSLLLKIYRVFESDLRYKLIFRLNYQFLYPLGIEEFCNIRIE